MIETDEKKHQNLKEKHKRLKEELLKKKKKKKKKEEEEEIQELLEKTLEQPAEA
ncbi:hypothetical protein Droror1_Dr00012096, partial [Drosera rotundifolia]